ncbi:MAG: SufS family cysteine desulfurase [Alphaproteobacteria bacterium]|nr:SufS family cysteine desulfurase [Alphaproteobacteria bacterium]
MTVQPAVRGNAKRTFDVQDVRSDFPILSRSVNGKPLVYLDNAASAQKPRAVIEAMTRAMETSYANVHRGLHALSTMSTDAYEHARETVRAFLNAREAAEIIFTSGATDSINLVANSLGASIDAGDEIVLSQMEHHSNIVPWHFLRERKGAVIRWAPIADNGSFDLEAFEKLLSPRTKLVSVAHMSNVLGTVTPAAEIVRIAHERGIPVLFDGAQSTVHMPIDVQALGCDFYAVTGHKLYGPTGIGVLYMKREWGERLPPFRGGGEMIDEVHFDRVTYGPPPMRFEAGTPPIIEAIGLGAAIDYINAFERAALMAHEHDLLNYATERLSQLNWIQIQGRAPGKGSIISFTMEGAHAHDVATLVDRQGVAVRAGHHCAQPLMDRLGVTATARASFAFYNTRGEVDTLVDALHRARAIFS